MSRMFRGLRDGEGFDAGTRGMEVMPGLEPQGDDLVIEKERASAFAGTETDIVLRAMAIDTLDPHRRLDELLGREHGARRPPTWATA